MKVLVLGKGGREHALVWKLAQSARAERVYCAPGNAGTARDGVNVDLDLSPNGFDRIAQFARKEQIGLVVVGPEDPLAHGIVDHLQRHDLRVFGPTKAAAQLEASKVFAKQFMRHADVPTAEFKVFDHPQPAIDYIHSRDYPLVIKADGLAAGKGVVVCSGANDAVVAVNRIMTREEFGATAGRRIVVEKRLSGEELSVLALVSNRVILPLQPSQDHKAAFDGDQGPNTGGMGAYCPAPLGTNDLMDAIDRDVLVPTVHAMKRRKTPFRGVLYAGVMVTQQGPRVLEFNCRFGDPETQPILMRLQTDLLDLLEATVDERLDEFDGRLLWDPRPAVCVVLASGGYPGRFEKGLRINGLDAAARLPDVQVFHAGTLLDDDQVRTDGGRVLAVTALGDSLADAKRRAYEAVDLISFPRMFYRRDIADKALAPRASPGAVSEPELQ